jgi:DNA-binding NarL/FixJ family response regulator
VRLKLVLIDDYQLFREGLKQLIEPHIDLEVVGEAADERSAYEIVEQTRPDVVLMDVSLTAVSGIATTRELRRRGDGVRILMLSMHAEVDYVAQALTAGASGYALKSQSASELLDAIRAVGRGENYLSPSIPRAALDESLRLRRRSGGLVDGPCAPLSAREREVFDLLVRGYSNDGIAGLLCISVKTVETHRARILRKLQLHSLVDLVRFAARNDLLRE